MFAGQKNKSHFHIIKKVGLEGMPLKNCRNVARYKSTSFFPLLKVELNQSKERHIHVQDTDSGRLVEC